VDRGGRCAIPDTTDGVDALASPHQEVHYFSSDDNESIDGRLPEGVLECNCARSNGFGSCRSVLLVFEGPNLSKSNPQSFVTSHQKEYSEFAAAARSQSRKSGCSPCHVSPVILSPFSFTRSVMTTRWAADRNITGKEVAYFKALKRGLRLSFAGRLYSIRHCRKRRKNGKL